MANKTQPGEHSVEDWKAKVPARYREAADELLARFTRLSGYEPVMWGPSIVGFGQYHYRYDSGREGDFLRVGFATRSKKLVFYIMPGFDGAEELLGRLGKHTTGSSCLYVNKLADIELDVLDELIVASLAEMAEKYPEERPV